MVGLGARHLNLVVVLGGRLVTRHRGVRGRILHRVLLRLCDVLASVFATDAESNTSFELDMRLRQPLEQWLGRKLEIFTDVQNVTDNRVIDSNVVRGRSFLIGLRGNFP